MSAIDVCDLRDRIHAALCADLRRQSNAALARAHEAMARYAEAPSPNDKAWQLQTACEALREHDEAATQLHRLGGDA